MIYLLKSDKVTKISETSGTIQNTDQINKVEISETETFENNIILYPLQKVTFQNQIYARLFDNKDLPVEIRVIPVQLNSGGGGNSSTVGNDIATDDEFDEMLNDVGFGT